MIVLMSVQHVVCEALPDVRAILVRAGLGERRKWAAMMNLSPFDEGRPGGARGGRMHYSEDCHRWKLQLNP